MRAAGTTNYVGLRHLQHGGLNISDGYRPDRRFAPAHADHQATAAALQNADDFRVAVIPNYGSQDKTPVDSS
jgi:hypothetical protein